MRNIDVYDDYESLCRAVAHAVKAAVKAQPDILLCLAAGHTSLGVFRAMAEDQRQGRVDYRAVSLVGMDEWQGMNDATPGSCGDFLRRELLSHLPLQEKNICLFDGALPDLMAECRRVERFIDQKGGIGYLLLGTGMNGHLALNEPGCRLDLGAHCTELDAVTRQVGKKYFRQDVCLTGGVTLGIANLLCAKSIVLAVSGKKKQEIVGRIFSGPVDNACPASLLRDVPHARYAIDQQAAALL